MMLGAAVIRGVTCDLAEEARTAATDQHADDQHQRDRELQLVADHEGAEHVLQHADQEAAEHRAARAVDAADQRRGEGVQQDAAHHVRIEVDDRRHHHAGDRADRRGEAPAEREHPADADADQPARLRVLRRGAHREAERREAEEQRTAAPARPA